MARPKIGTASDGRPMHYSVGAIIRNGPSYLLFDRVNFPFGFAAPAGHIDEGEDDPADAVIREVREETGLITMPTKLLCAEEVPFDTCSRGIEVHFWYLFECTPFVAGKFKADPAEARSMGWYTPNRDWPKNMSLVWAYWFRRLGICE